MADLKPLLDFIAGPESAGNYNAFYGNSQNQEINLNHSLAASVAGAPPCPLRTQRSPPAAFPNISNPTHLSGHNARQ